jgi:hypothetical protein
MKTFTKILLTLTIALLVSSTTWAAPPPPSGHFQLSFQGPGRQHSPFPHQRGQNTRIYEARWYADTATNQTRAAARMGCGYSGPRWTTRWNEHYNWALNAPTSRLHREVDRRDHKLAQCHAKQARHRHMLRRIN